MSDEPSILWFEEVGAADVPRVGGKNASLGEMVRALSGAGVRVPPGLRHHGRRLPGAGGRQRHRRRDAGAARRVSAAARRAWRRRGRRSAG